MIIGDVRLEVVFFRTAAGREPVRSWLKSLPQSHKKTIGEDIKTLQFGWPMGMPLVEKIQPDLWIVRSKVRDGNQTVSQSPNCHREPYFDFAQHKLWGEAISIVSYN